MGQERRRVVVIGAGFGGLAAVRALREVPVDVTLVDEHNYHLFQPLLYQVATALLDPSEVAHPVRPLVRRQRNCDVRVGRVVAIDLAARRVRTAQGALEYDHLIVAAGSVTTGLGLPGVERHTFGLKTLGDALALRNHLLAMVESAAWCSDPVERRRLLTVGVVGAGPTGVECSGAITELVRLVLRRDFPHLRVAAEVRVVLMEAGQSVLSSFAPALRRRALRTLMAKGVEVRLRTAVAHVDERGLTLAGGEELPTATVVWTAGVRGAAAGGLAPDGRTRGGRILVGADMTLEGHPEVSVIGDLAEYLEDGRPLPMLAPVAIQQGGWVARRLAASLRGDTVEPFHYRDRGTMATIGRNSAITQVGRLHLWGFPGWLVWLGFHLLQIVSFRSKAVTLLNWAWDYMFYDRPVRLITAPAPDRAAVGAERDAGRSGWEESPPGA